MSKRILIFGFAVLLLGLGCQTGSSSGDEKQAEGKLKVVATTGMIADMVTNIGGERVHVTGLMGPGIDPHLYKATAGDISKMSEADMIVYNGLHLEGKMAELFEQLGSKKKTVAVSDALSEEDLISSEGMQDQHDPHIWFDVSLWNKAAVYMMEQLILMDPEGADIIRKNGEVYIQKLRMLDDYVGEKMSVVDPENRVLVTAHDAFHYFGKAYNVEVKGLQGISTASEAGTADVTELAQFLVDRKISAVFVESSVPTRYMEALKEAVLSRNHNVVIGGSLFSDAMGNDGTPEGTYIGMVRHNADTISQSLKKE